MSCPGCGGVVEASEAGRAKVFCSDKCRRDFNNRAKAEGGPLAPLVKAWIATRHAPKGSPEAAICSFAMGELTNIGRAYLDRDQDEGRDAVAYVETLRASGFRWADRARS